jgi:hypothetical protein
VAFSYFELLIPKTWAAAHHFAAGGFYAFSLVCFIEGVVFLSEGIAQKVGGVSLMRLLTEGGWRHRIRTLATAAAVGLLLEAVAQWLGKLWYYPYYPTWFYWPSLVLSFLLYWVFIVESYLAGKALLDRWLRVGGRWHPHEHALKYYSFEPPLYYLLGMAGVGMFIYSMVRMYFAYEANIIGGGYHFDVLHASNFAPPYHLIMWAFIGLWLACEGALYASQKPSLLYSMLHGYITPLLALVGTALLLALVWESQNAMVDFWVYQNWPLPDAKIFNVQWSVILTWPANYVVYLLPAAALIPAWGHKFFARPSAELETLPPHELAKTGGVVTALLRRPVKKGE